MATKKKKVESWRKALPKQLNEFQATLEKRVRKGVEQVTEMLPVEPRKAVKRFTADVEKFRHNLRKRGDKVLADTRKRTEKFTAEVQKRVEGVVEGAIVPLTKTLDLASHTEVERLRKRLEHVEHRLEARAESATA